MLTRFVLSVLLASFRNRSSPEVDGQFAPSSQLERSPSRNNSKLLLQKDKLIESLRLELAESQIKLVEMENKGGGRQRELEKELLEARMANARLMEDNESYQLLLSEKTLNGDFSKGEFMREAHPDTSSEAQESSNGLGSLADELESVDVKAETDNTRKLEAEIRGLKDQNKALTLYIERIISRLLQHEGFESILDKSENDPPPTAKPKAADKDLPPTPAESEDGGNTFLQRARTAVSGPNNPQSKPRSRPSSYMPPPTSAPMGAPTAHENPETAPSIPLNRAQSVRMGHRRARSDQADVSAAAVVGQMYRGRSSAGPVSPTVMGPGSRQSLFSGGSVMSSGMSTNGRAPSLSSQPEQSRLSSSDSVTSDLHETASTGATSSSPRSSTGMNNYTGAVMAQNKLRPLRLVSEASKAAEEEETARKKANRGSWISWFNRPNAPNEATQQQQQQQQQ